jgi:CRP-like cAMP-binding protein
MTLNLESFNRFAKQFKNGDIIFSEFELGDTFYLIKEGQVELVKFVENTEKTLTILSVNEMFGEMAILEMSPRSATAIAHGDCVLLEFNSKNFQSLMLGLPELALTLLKSFIARMYEAKNKYRLLSKQDPADRIAEAFVQLDKELPPEKRMGDERTFQITVDSLARLAGMSIEQTRDALNRFMQEKRIMVMRDSVVVNRIAYFQKYVKKT